MMAKAKQAKAPAPVQALEFGITQQELGDYLVVAGSASLFTKQQETLKKSIKERIEAGASIEPGRYSALIIPTQRSAFSVAAQVVKSLKVIDSALLEEDKAAG